MKRRVASSVLLLVLVGCTGNDRSVADLSPGSAEPAGVRERALLLLMADRRYYDSFTVGSVRLENPELTASLATTLGRIGDERGLPALHSLLLDAKPAVRREAAFAIGLIGDRASTDDLLAALTDTDRETAVWAAVGLAAIGAGPDRVAHGMKSLSEPDRWSRLAPSLQRFEPGSVQTLAAEGLRRTQREVRAWSLFALARDPQIESLALLRSQIEVPEPWLRGWVARALGRVGDRTDLVRLRPLLDDGSSSAVIQALRAAGRLIETGMAAAPVGWRPRLLALMADERSGVSLTAIEIAAYWLPDAELATALRVRAVDGTRRERELALVALARAGEAWALDQATRLVTAGQEWQRALAAEVATIAGDADLLDYLRLDSSAVIRTAAVGGILSSELASKRSIALAALEDSDPGVRAVAMEWLIDNPVAATDRISRAIVGKGSRLITELRIFGIRALLARARAEPLERGLAVENLESLARVGEYPARREAAAALVELDRPAPPIGPAGSQKSTTTYMQIVMQTDRDHVVEIETRHGNLQLELMCSQARMTCLNFLQLARQGYYDGQIFHRVVPDFVVQAGDPRGDGWGGPGYTLRDELNRTPFERGVVGMASSGPDTAGSQFFVTLSRQPHLDGRYTAFGRVVQGTEILDRIVQGDRLERVSVVR